MHAVTATPVVTFVLSRFDATTTPEGIVLR
jgi:hypothetical protein